MALHALNASLATGKTATPAQPATPIVWPARNRPPTVPNAPEAGM